MTTVKSALQKDKLEERGSNLGKEFQVGFPRTGGLAKI